MLVTQIFRQKKAHRIITVSPDTLVSDAVETMKDEHIGALMVMDDDGALAGIISERDIVRALPEHAGATLGLSVGKLMTSPVVTCGPDAHVDDIMQTMTARHFRHMPVLEDGQLIGMISIGDVVKSRLDELETESTHLQNYIAGIE